MALLSRKLLLTRQELKTEKVELGDGDFVFVRQMTGKERDNWERSMMKRVNGPKGVTFEQSLENFRAKLAVNTMCDEKGTLLLQPSDVDKLGECISAARLSTIVDAAQKLNKITSEDKENIIKNSEAAHKDNSTSD